MTPLQTTHEFIRPKGRSRMNGTAVCAQTPLPLTSRTTCSSSCAPVPAATGSPPHLPLQHLKIQLREEGPACCRSRRRPLPWLHRNKTCQQNRHDEPSAHTGRCAGAVDGDTYSLTSRQSDPRLSHSRVLSSTLPRNASGAKKAASMSRGTQDWSSQSSSSQGRRVSGAWTCVSVIETCISVSKQVG